MLVCVIILTTVSPILQRLYFTICSLLLLWKWNPDDYLGTSPSRIKTYFPHSLAVKCGHVTKFWPKGCSWTPSVRLLGTTFKERVQVLPFRLPPPTWLEFGCVDDSVKSPLGPWGEDHLLRMEEGQGRNTLSSLCPWTLHSSLDCHPHLFGREINFFLTCCGRQNNNPPQIKKKEKKRGCPRSDPWKLWLLPATTPLQVCLIN